MDGNLHEVQLEALGILQTWLASCTRGNKVSRNTIAVGIVVLDHLRSASQRMHVVEREDVVSPGGEIRGARSGLSSLLLKYEIPVRFLKEATTRQAHQDGQRLFEAFEWGVMYTTLPQEHQEQLWQGLLAHLKTLADEWFQRENLKPDIDRRQAPTAWLRTIVEEAKGKSGGVVEQHLVGAKLERRFKHLTIDNHPAHAADQQTSRNGDFRISNNVYHVTASPGPLVMKKCARNLQDGLRPILLIPDEQKTKAKVFAEEANIDLQLTIISIEDFVSLNIIEMAIEDSSDVFSILKTVIETYNRRLSEVETDLSLRIEIR